MAGRCKRAHAVFIFEDTAEVIVDMPVFLAGASQPAPGAVTANRVLVLDGPGNLIVLVDELLNVEVAGQPREIVSISHLVLHLGHIRLPRTHPDSAAESNRVQRRDLANGTLVNPSHQLLHFVGIA